ncbi:MAG: RusA family crossover junction endodeoxyribonuclease [Clostridia bacterium]|nr:RusA family crossover junction endodeoxyribonuclease [Clostridia bacterium]
MIEFTLHTDPPRVTHQQQKTAVVNGKPRRYDPPELKAARALFEWLLKRYAPPTPITAPVRLFVQWRFPKGRHKDGEWKITRPDTDNLQKLLKDCMTAVGFWRDDSYVVSETAEKIWATSPGIYVRIETL